LAEETWTNALSEEDFDCDLLYFQILRENDLTSHAREKLSPLIIKFLETKNADDSADFENLIRAVAESFSSETEKSRYFRQILSRRPTDTSLAELLVNENLIGENEQKVFYEMLVERSDEFNDYDYKYT